MKNSYLLSIIGLFVFAIAPAQNQGQKASLNDDGTISVESIVLPDNYGKQPENFDLLWRFGRPANPTFKNTRGTTLADIDKDGIDEILYGINNKLYALKGDGNILFEKTVSGTILLPPSVADLDNDGTLEIAVNTGGIPNAGRVYLLDPTGTDLPGWPLNFSDHWMINAPALADVDGDGTLDIVFGERVTSNQGFVHAVKMDGTPVNANWPVEVAATPAFTPSIADVDNDGNNDVVIAASSAGMYIFDNQGQIFPGFPVVDPNVKYSYQSPILADLDDNGDLEIIGSNHGDAHAFYVMEHDGSYRPGWPIATSEWTYSPPTVLDVDGDEVFEIFMSDRNTSGTPGVPLPVIYGLDPDGNNLPNFPIEKYGGTEGVLSIADVNNDGVLEIIFPSVITESDNGFIHAYSLDGSGEVAGFPLRPRGFTFLNGAVLGDVDNDGLLDLTANSYTQTFGTGVDSTFVNVYNLNVPYDPDSIKRNGYKSDNTRDGFVEIEQTASIAANGLHNTMNIAPNPSSGLLSFTLSHPLSKATVTVYGIDGKVVFSREGTLAKKNSYNLSHLNNGLYFIAVMEGDTKYTGKWVKK